MIKNKRLILGLGAVFCTAEAVLGVLLQISSGRDVAWYCFASVVLACLFCSVFAEGSRAYIFTQIAMICTVFADYFLLIAPQRQQLPAMLFFSVTQLGYFLRIYFYDESKTRRILHVALRAIASVVAVAVTAAVLGEGADAVAMVSMFYYANLLVNAAFAFVNFKKAPILAVGLLFFALCDVFIGLSFIDDYLPISPDSIIYKLLYPGFDPAWAFYLPSQTLIAVSLLWDRRGD